MPRSAIRMLFSLISFLLAMALQIKFATALGWSFDLMLLTMVVPAFFLGAAEFLFFGAFCVFLLRIIYPFGLPEIAALAAIPLAIFVLKRVVFWQSWFEPLLAAVFGVFGFYILSGSDPLANGYGFIIMDLTLSVALGWGLYWIFGKFLSNERQGL